MGCRRGVGDPPPGECLSACQGLEGWGWCQGGGLLVQPPSISYMSPATLQAHPLCSLRLSVANDPPWPVSVRGALRLTLNSR